MKVRYRANGSVRDLSEEAGCALVDAGVCDAVDGAIEEQPEGIDRSTGDGELLTPERSLETRRRRR